MACSCRPKSKAPEPGLSTYSVSMPLVGLGSVVNAGIQETCLLEINGSLRKVKAGDMIKTYDVFAQALLQAGAPIWIAA